MRIVLFITFLICSNCGYSQDTLLLRKAIKELDVALVAKDTATLDKLLDKKVSYGHSNGWIQTKQDVRNDFVSGKVVYDKIESSEVRILNVDKDLATVSLHSNASGSVNGKAFSLSLHVMQIWKNDKKGWQLFGRQSAKQN